MLQACSEALDTNIEAISRKLNAASAEQARVQTVNQVNSKGQTPLMFAAFSGKHEAAKVLMQMVRRRGPPNPAGNQMNALLSSCPSCPSHPPLPHAS